jgi:toxin ParE1/3/4
MRLRILKHSAAKRDVLDLFDHISVDNETAALRFLSAAESSFRDLAQNPAIGTACEYRGARGRGLRRWRVKGFENYLIFYRPFSDRVEIVRVLHGARDLKRMVE